MILPIILITKKPTNIKEYVIHFVRTGNFFKAYKLLTNSCEEEKNSSSSHKSISIIHQMKKQKSFGCLLTLRANNTQLLVK
jgi:hypothetical protein